MARVQRALAATVVTAAVVLLTSLVAAPAAAEVTLDAEETAAVRALNEYRVSRGLAPFSVSPILTRVAEWMAADQADRDALSHTDQLGRGLRERNNAFGYPSNTVIRENLAAGHATGEATMQQWMDSPGHYANNVATDVSTIGIARVPAGPGSLYGWFWVLEFGSVEDAGSIHLDDAVAGAPSSPPGDEFVGDGPGTFVNIFPDRGVRSNIWNGGTVEEFIAAVADGAAHSVWVAMPGGSFRSYFVDAPAFARAHFARGFPGGIPANTVVLVVR